MSTVDVERELSGKGYDYYKGYKNRTDAMEKAKELRKCGYYARVVTYTTAVRGWNEYAVWWKKKEVQ